MENNKKIYSRFALTHDIEANWLNKTELIPMQGEFIVYDVERDNDPLPPGRSERYRSERYKIGDGRTKLNDLPMFGPVYLGEGYYSVIEGISSSAIGN